MMPERMIEQGYQHHLWICSASAALLEALIPPSNYNNTISALTNVPVSKTFAAGVIQASSACLMVASGFV